ncbi:14329_t:CDS:10 [Racocetra fulgida]|uniref:14329_t:CDS:1 n=1 Tax=Racocetra fulgida TaxID=60492 RepID=A0A9N8WBZ5_9GLOM|nr:14329_t:CDS:10 [Racocetra fulgida]
MGSLTSQTPLSQEQLSALKYQILAFKLISHNLEVPAPLQQAMFSPGQSQGLSAQEITGTPLTGKLVEASYNHHSRTSPNPTAEAVSSAQASASTPLYNAYTNPLTYLKPVNTYSHASRQQRMLIPAIMPIGLDPNEIAAERERQIKARVQQRICALEYALEAGLYQSQAEKIKLLIELKGKKVFGKQKKASYHESQINYLNLGDRLEKQQREDRQRVKKQKHLDRIQSICNHGRDLIQCHRTSQAKQLKFGRAVVSYHSQVEKEEQKRLERLSKERLRALKNDDEEAYLKLIDKVKDTRITHLLKQTDQYLDSLAQAVVAQQRDELHKDPTVRGGIELMDDEEDIGEDENITIVVDYYAVAHRIKEEVEQPSIMIGGSLKDYQGAPNTRKELQQQFIKHVDFQVLLTTYEYIIKDKSILSKLRWVYVIIDEGHRMKNTKSKLSNNLPELWSLLNFILPRIFDSVKSFDEWFNTPFANAAGQDKIALNEEESLLIIRRLHKKDVESELPDKVETVIKCRLSALQLKLYSQMKKHGVLFVNTGEKGYTIQNCLIDKANLLAESIGISYELLINFVIRKTGIKGLNNTIMQLRKICNHPFVFEEVEKDINPGNTNSALLYRVSGKFELLDRILPKFFATGHRVAQDRAHRIGQTREVRILRLISQKSIEETILARAQYKLDIDGKVIQAGKFDNKSTENEREELLLIARNEDELIKFKQIDQERTQREEMEWKKSGGKGKRPDRLIEESELPPVYIKEYDAIVRQEEPGVEYGRGQRPRGSVHYDDGLTEEQWVNAIEDEDIDVEDLIAKKQAAKKRRLVKKSQKLHSSTHLDISHNSTPHPDESSADAAEYKKKRGRPRKDEMPSVDDNNAHDIQSKQSKKKGKGKRVETSDFETFDQPKNKKRKQQPKKTHEQTSSDTVSPHTRDRMRRIFNRCYSAVENLMDDTEGFDTYLFLTLPSKKEYDYYYTVINNPIAMDTIKRRIKLNHYQSAAQFRDDWHLMFNNARTFNEEASTVYNDAEKLQEVFDETFEELCPGGQIPPSGDEMDI